MVNGIKFINQLGLGITWWERDQPNENMRTNSRGIWGTDGMFK